MTLRRATPDDAAELARLRVLMYASWGEDASGDLEAASVAFLRDRLADDDFAAYVVEDGGRLVASGIGWVERHLPSPKVPSGRRGHVASMSTEPAAQRQGHGRAVLLALLDWFGSLGIDRVDLSASDAGEPLYRSVGFTDAPYPHLRWHRTHPSPPAP